MKKNLLILALLNFFGSTNSWAQTPRKINWADSRRAIIGYEGIKPSYVSETDITYDSVLVHDYKLRLSYTFKDNKLKAVSYYGKAPLSDSLKIKSTFLALLNEAIIDYGEPTVLTDDNNPIKRLTFKSKSTRVSFFFGPIANSYYSLNVQYAR